MKKCRYNLEHDAQVAVFQWWQQAHKGLGVPDVLLAIPNGGMRHMSVARSMKAEGARPGVPDMFLPVPVNLTMGKSHVAGYAGLWIELKRDGLKPKRGGKGGVSDLQRQWLDTLAGLGYRCKVCYGSAEAIEAITDYLKP